MNTDTSKNNAHTFAYTEHPSDGIVNIPISLLYHHPDNPRKDLGDLTELAASIKARGVMQNLTVVPFRDNGGTGCYHVVIGNRRMEAAKIAGLATLPCIITQMSAAEQVQTMLLENMQRVDLTPFEQAQGFQMMMDFGDSVEKISEKTGFSATTVRRRLKMAELDQNTLKEVSDRQLSLGDFDRLAEIENINERNEILKHIGTSSFEWKLKGAKDAQAQRELQEKWRTALVDLGFTEISKTEGWGKDYAPLYGNVGTQIRLDQKSPDAIDIASYDAAERYFYFDYGWVYLRQKKREEAEEKDDAFSTKEREREECYKKLEEASKRAYDLRLAFVKGVSESHAKGQLPLAVSAVAACTRHVNYNNELDELFDCESDAVAAAAAKAPYRAALFMAFIAKGGMQHFSTYNWQGLYTKSQGLYGLYDFLTTIGYDASPEELALLDGTSTLYAISEVSE